MNDDIQRLRKLVDAYRLSRPVSPELQRLAIESRIPDLRRILMKTGKYSLIAWFVIMIFTLFRKYGLHVTMIQSKIIAGITAAAVASGSAAAAYRGAQYIIEATTRPAAQTDETIERLERDKAKKIENNAPDAINEHTFENEKQSIPIYKDKIAPAENKIPAGTKQDKEKKRVKEHNSVSDIPSL